jgi:orotate phosphoribosyltransferase
LGDEARSAKAAELGSQGAGERRDGLTSGDGFTLRGFYARQMAGKRVMLADDVRNTGKTYQRCAELVREAGGTVIATVQICDRMEAMVDLGVPNYALVEYKAPDNYPVEPITSF